ncbi:MAG TPA: hypothetical protein VNS63_05340 [Blastocatellia bacterium]|nr:hypothetical protein [Blastocatellia bacterium]
MKPRAKVIDRAEAQSEWKLVDEIPGFPFETFDQMQAGVAIKSFNIGVDPLAAAKWSSRFNSRTRRAVVAALSLLIVIAGAASVVTALVTSNYWLFAAVPLQVAAFYVSHPASPIRKWVTVGGAVSVVAFVDLLFNGSVTAATLVAYAGLTFAAVRAAAFIANSSFRKALLKDEELFVAAFASGVCTLRNNRTKRVYSPGSR